MLPCYIKNIISDFLLGHNVEDTLIGCQLFINVCVFVKLFRSARHVAYLHVKMCDIGNSFYVITVLFLLVYCI